MGIELFIISGFVDSCLLVCVNGVDGSGVDILVEIVWVCLRGDGDCDVCFIF